MANWKRKSKGLNEGVVTEGEEKAEAAKAKTKEEKQMVVLCR